MASLSPPSKKQNVIKITDTATNPKGVTYTHQQSLHKLPIPALEDSLKKYYDACAQVIQDETELAQLKRLIDEFLKNDGPKLQEQLMDYEKNKNSFVEEFWDDAYLEYQVPVCINVNPVFVLEDDPTPSRNDLIARAVSLIFSSLKYARALRKEILHPDKVKDAPLCMYQYKRLFGSARVPHVNGEEKDMIITHSNSTYIVVMCRGQIYYFDCLYTDDGELGVTERELAKNLLSIITDAKKTPQEKIAFREEAGMVGLLTSETRPVWRKLRKELGGISHNNSRVLDTIDGALFIVCLDDEFVPASVDEFAANLLHGSEKHHTSANRWYDKLQLIVAKDGSAGVNFEHSACDGHTVLRFASDIFTDTIIRFAQTISGGIPSHLATHSEKEKARPDSKPRKLEFELNENISRSIKFAQNKLCDMCDRNDTVTLEYSGYGKNFLISNNLSPDATIQLVMQLAYYELYGECANVYESVLTKQFYHGRTEAGRSLTAEAREFLKSVGCERQVSAGERDEASVNRRLGLLRKAVKAHSHMTAEFSKGKGFDRHLYSLHCLAIKNGTIPALFTHGTYRKINEFVLSTSNCGNPCLRFFGFGPVCEKGFGLGYIIKDDSINIMITSKKRQTEKLKNKLIEILEFIHDELLFVKPVETIASISLRSFSKFHSSYDLNATVNAPPVEEDSSSYDFFGIENGRVGRQLSL